MKNAAKIFVCLAVITLALTACGWKPSVAAVSITAPWDKMNLPVSQNAVVWASDEKQLKVVHQDNKKTVMDKYVEALKSQGWTLAQFDNKSDTNYFIDMAKGADKISIEIYDFENTGVIIKKK